MSQPAKRGIMGTVFHRRKPRFSDLVTVILVVALILLALELIPANDYLLLPGDALAVAPMIRIDGYPHRTFPGRLYLTDVTIYKVNHLLEELYGKVNPDADLEPAQQVSGGLSERQYLQYNAQLMTDSIQEAEAAALRVARGYKVKLRVLGPEIVVVLPNAPAQGVLQAGDIIKAIDGHAVHRVTQVSPLIQRVGVGHAVHLTVLRHTRVIHVGIRTAGSTNGKIAPTGKRPVIGVELRDRVDFVFPVKIHVNHGGIVGPSAGMMFTLGVIEQLQQRDIAHGCKVAGTGTIDYLGHVGEIGGARQKAIAASHAGATVFLVPNVPANVDPARSAHDGMTIVPVSTVQQALHYLDHLKPCR